MQIGPLAPGHFDAAIALWHDVGLTRPWNDPAEDLRRAVGGPASTVLAGTDGDALTATAMVGHDGHRGWVYYLAVSPGAQGSGHGRAMMKACEAWLAERGVPKLQVMVRTDNEGVQGFYASLGYLRSGVAVFQRELSRGSLGSP
jgi:ribosomal protein S18 acetylase RimI-like enzyme